LSYTPVCTARAARPLHAATASWMQGARRGFLSPDSEKAGATAGLSIVEPGTRPRIGRSIQSLMAATTPAPTVRPPSRMAKRSFSSMATGTISVTSMVTLSPGITISVPSGSSHTPVTSVVRK